MNNEFMYDVAISCAEEDLGIAEQIAASFKTEGVSYFLYTEHRAEHWGKDLFKVSLDKYGAESKYVLMLISSTYIKKHWSDLERQISQTVQRVGEEFILPLRIDDTPVDGLSKNILYEKWKNNPGEIARIIK